MCFQKKKKGRLLYFKKATKRKYLQAVKMKKTMANLSDKTTTDSSPNVQALKDKQKDGACYAIPAKTRAT